MDARQIGHTICTRRNAPVVYTNSKTLPEIPKLNSETPRPRKHQTQRKTRKRQKPRNTTDHRKRRKSHEQDHSRKRRKASNKTSSWSSLGDVLQRCNTHIRNALFHEGLTKQDRETGTRSSSVSHVSHVRTYRMYIYIHIC